MCILKQTNIIVMQKIYLRAKHISFLNAVFELCENADVFINSYFTDNDCGISPWVLPSLIYTLLEWVFVLDKAFCIQHKNKIALLVSHYNTYGYKLFIYYNFHCHDAFFKRKVIQIINLTLLFNLMFSEWPLKVALFEILEIKSISLQLILRR